MNFFGFGKKNKKEEEQNLKKNHNENLQRIDDVIFSTL
jgi:hypothetical protein